MLVPSLKIGGPRGNKCHGCGKKVKAPELVLNVPIEYNRYASVLVEKNFCIACGLVKVEETIETLKKIVETINSGSVAPENLGRRRVKVL